MRNFAKVGNGDIEKGRKLIIEGDIQDGIVTSRDLSLRRLSYAKLVAASGGLVYAGAGFLASDSETILRGGNLCLSFLAGGLIDWFSSRDKPFKELY